MSDLKRGFMDRRQRGGPEEVLRLDHVDSPHVPRRLLPKKAKKKKEHPVWDLGVFGWGLVELRVRMLLVAPV